MQERDIKFFRPMWRRVVVIGLVAIWSAIEFWNGDQFWGFATLLVAGYLVWSLIISFPAEAAESPASPEDDNS